LDKHARILVVDDDESIRKTLAIILGEQGYQVDTAENGKEAVSKSITKVYNLALIDIRLPDMEGIELLTRMRDTIPRMRKIIITGYPTISNAIDAVNRRADAYVLKPFKMDKVLETIKEQLGKQGEEEKYSEQKVADFIETRARELETNVTSKKSQ
jgi:DNA-binding NtrC family response regulator